MLRILVAVLLVANALFLGYTRGWFDGVLGLNSIGDREPDRLARQVRPESVRVLPPAKPASGPAACYEAGPFNPYEALSAEAVLKSALPAGTWADERSEVAGTTGPMVTHTYRVAAADPALAARLAALRLDPDGRTFSVCAKAAPTR